MDHGMEKVKAFFRWYRHSWLYRFTFYILAFIIVLILVDRIVMPLYVHLGDEIEMPDVIEMNVEEARTKLSNQGFKVFVKDSLYDADHPVGTVIEQSPYPYATVKEGRRVYLTMSIGEKPIIMPKLFGVSPREAELILETYNLNLNSKSYVFSDIYHEGTVMAQSYPPGQPIKAGSKIDITISLGILKEEMKIPDLVGISLHEAKEKLKALRLNIGEITFEERDNILPETVLSQSPKPGEFFKPGDIINLTVSKENM
jgi:beta-lactam-binding protein with PASTA domain